MSELSTAQVQIQVGQHKMGAFLARPKDSSPRPAVLVFQEIFGVNAHIREVTERIAREGYVALAPDYFWRTDPGMELAYDQEGQKRGMSNLMKLDSEQLLQDIKASLAFLRGLPEVRAERVGCVGFCIGGHIAYLAACETDIVATASFYGGSLTTMRPGGGAPTVTLTRNIRGEVLCFFGEKDALIPQEQVDVVRKHLTEAKISHQVVVYPEASHGFFCNQRSSYHQPSSEDAWAKVKELFSKRLNA